MPRHRSRALPREHRVDVDDEPARSRRPGCRFGLAPTALLLLALNALAFAHNEVARLSLTALAAEERPAGAGSAPRGDAVSARDGSLLRELCAAARRIDFPRERYGAMAPAGGAAAQRKRFRVQRSRADYRVSVTGALSELGLVGTNDSWDFDVYWGSQWAEHRSFLDSRLRPHMAVSSVLGLWAESLGDKDFLGHAIQLCEAQHGRDACDFVPPIYSMPAQASQWRNAFKRHRYWMRKDKKVWGSAGVMIISSPEQPNPHPHPHPNPNPIRRCHDHLSAKQPADRRLLLATGVCLGAAAVALLQARSTALGGDRVRPSTEGLPPAGTCSP